MINDLHEHTEVFTQTVAGRLLAQVHWISCQSDTMGQPNHPAALDVLGRADALAGLLEAGLDGHAHDVYTPAPSDTIDSVLQDMDATARVGRPSARYDTLAILQILLAIRDLGDAIEHRLSAGRPS